MTKKGAYSIVVSPTDERFNQSSCDSSLGDSTSQVTTHCRLGEMGCIKGMRNRLTVSYAIRLAIVLFVGLFAATVTVFLTHHTLIWHGDEFYQGVNKLFYFSRTVRSAFGSFVTGSGFAFPAYTLSSGYGIDTADLLGSFGNVFDWPSVFCPTRYLEYYYVAMIFVRVILSGIAFSYYSLQHGATREGAFLGSVCYSLSGYVVFLGVLRHPMFLTVAVFFPLVLAGADRVFRGERSWLFVVAAAFQFLTSVYNAYMVCLALFAYCFISYFASDRKRSVTDFILLVGKFIALLAIAFLISSVIAYPRVVALLSEERLGLSRYKATLFDFHYYFDLPTDVIGGTVRSKSVYFGAVGIVVLEAFLTCGHHLEKRQRAGWLAGLLLVLACVLFPALSRAFNGFTYATDRWMFVLAFCCSYIVCMMVPVLGELKRKEWVRVLVFSGIVLVVCLGKAALENNLTMRLLVMLGLFAVASTAIPFLNLRASRRTTVATLTVLSIVGVAVSSAIYCLPIGSDFAKEFRKMGSIRSTVFDTSYAAAADRINDSEEFRYIGTKPYGMRNAGLNHSTNAVDFYNSVYNQNTDNLRKELGMADDFFNFRFFGSDGRLAIDALTDTKYYVTTEGDKWLLPYGFEKTKFGKGNYLVYENSSYVPMGFVTSKTVDRSVYEALKMEDKQTALLQGCVIADDVASRYHDVVPCTSSEAHEFKISAGNNVIVDAEGHTISVLKSGSSITLEFTGREKSETYVKLSNLQYAFLTPSETAQLKGSAATAPLKDLLAVQPTKYTLRFKSNGKTKAYEVGTNRNNQYGGKHDWLFNLGYSKAVRTRIDITFQSAGVYTYDALQIVSQPVEPIANLADELAMGGAKNLTFDGSTLNATFDCFDEASLAVFTVPFSKGWTAQVDGKSAPIMKADTAFMAVELLGTGKHEVTLTYSNANSRTGFILSFIGIAGLVVLVAVERKRKRPAHAH